ncbi:MAG: hypothetical protein GX551_01710, partial [Clostridiaceae bacterium]|nr:hypothetical protein [Clostridiaceae bacterium]
MADKASIQKAGKLKDREFFSGSRRFALLAGLISMILLVVLLRTGSLQLFGDHDVAIPETVGRMSEIKLDAPRGDIVDRNGVPLAVSDAVNRVEMVSARMTNEQLNRYLLDIARLFDEYGCPFNSPLLKWFDVPSEYRSLKLLETSESLPFVFRQSYDEIFLWQTDRDLFNLTDPEKATTERLRRRMVREDPDDFFDYLLYDFFVIEPDRSSGSRLYTDGEAFTIMQLRYLLLENNWLFVSGQPLVLADEVPESLSARLVEQNYRFPGLVVTRHYKRRYTDDARYVGHALGYVGLISSNEYNRLKNDGYGINDVVGKTGVEQAAERYLRGESGRMTLNSWYGEGASDPVTYPGD